MSDDLAALMQNSAGADKFGAADGWLLRTISDKANEALEERRALELLEAQVKDKKLRIRDIEEKELPSLMEEAGMKKFELEDGSQISMSDEVYISITADKRNDAYEWLGANGHGSIVKHEVACQFGKGEDDRAEGLKHMLEESGFKFSDKQNIHPATLKSWAKEELENGRIPPDNLFNLFELTVAKIKPAK